MVMGYLKEFQKEITNRDFAKFMVLWEEYCTSDSAPASEMIELLQLVKSSDYAKAMGGVMEMLIPIINTLPTPEERYSVLRPLFDIQTTNSPALAEIALTNVERLYSKHPHYNEILRLTSLRNKENVQGALSAVDLLAHLKVGNFVFHQGGWGAGEIMELSFLRETAVFEFEHSPGQKSMTITNAMRSMSPLAKTHFLARRFGDPDKLEKEAKIDPASLVKMLLADIGPKTAAEIKDALCELVIPEADWTKWWQQARSKLKKDLSVETPSQLKEPFYLRNATLSHDQEFLSLIKKKKGVKDILSASHSFSKEHPQELKNAQVKESFLNALKALENAGGLTPSQELEIHLMRAALYPDFKQSDLETIFFKSQNNLVELVEGIEILQYKKQALMWIRKHRAEWPALFLSMLSITSASLIREYLVKELSEKKDQLEAHVNVLVENPSKNPDLFFWLFNRAIIQQKDDVPSEASQEKWWEALLVLLNRIENMSSFSDLNKKIYVLITANRYKEPRELFKNSSLEFTKEFLLLLSKCHIFAAHEQKSLKALAAVRFPELITDASLEDSSNSHIIWTTEAAYLKVQEKIRHIGTVETVDNAREIEAARALGDLRENSEYKFAKERRSRLQGEMKHLSDMIGHARIITKQDVSSEEIGPGSVVDVEDVKGHVIQYQVMGPWDADPEKFVLSMQSKLAQTMIGMRVGDTFQFKDEKFKIKSLKTIFDT